MDLYSVEILLRSEIKLSQFLFRFLKSGIYKEALLCEISGGGVGAKEKEAEEEVASNSAASALSSLNKHSLGRKSKVKNERTAEMEWSLSHSESFMRHFGELNLNSAIRRST